VTKVLILIESPIPPSFRVDKTGITFDHHNDHSRDESAVTFISLDAVDNTYGPQGTTATNAKIGSFLDTYG